MQIELGHQCKNNNGVNKSTYKWYHWNQMRHNKSWCYELVGHLKWWDHTYDSWKKNFKMTSTTTIIKTKIENVAEKSSIFVVVTNNSDKFSNISALISINAHII